MPGRTLFRRLRRKWPRLAPGPSRSAGPEDGGPVGVRVEVAEDRVGLGWIGELEEEVGVALLRGAGPGGADFPLAGEDAVVRLLLLAVLEGHELDFRLHRQRLEGAFLTEEVVLAERTDGRHGCLPFAAGGRPLRP